MIEHQTDRGLRAGMLTWAAAALIGAGIAWSAGSLPWLVGGMRLPVSSGWPGLAPEDEVRVALPFGEYHLVDMLVFTLVGGAAGVVVSRLPRAFGPASAAEWAGAAGALFGVALAMAQTVRTVWPLLGDGEEARLLVTTLVSLGALGASLGVAAGFGIVRRTWWSPVGAALLAGGLGTWVVSLLVVLLGDRAAGGLQLVTPWLVGALVAGALVWTGWPSAGRWAWWPVVMAILWAMPAVMAAMYYVGPYARTGMGDGPGRSELIDATLQVFVDALRPSHHATTPYVVGLLVALAVSAVHRIGWPRGTGSAAPTCGAVENADERLDTGQPERDRRNGAHGDRLSIPRWLGPAVRQGCPDRRGTALARELRVCGTTTRRRAVITACWLSRSAS